MSGQVSRGSAGEYQAMSGQELRGSVGEYQADEQAGVARLSWRVSISFFFFNFSFCFRRASQPLHRLIRPNGGTWHPERRKRSFLKRINGVNGVNDGFFGFHHDMVDFLLIPR